MPPTTPPSDDAPAVDAAAGPGMADVGDPALDRVHLGVGSRVGRFVLLARIGSGGMGVVHAAYDPDLDRKVALKVLKVGEPTSEARLRLQREAQALARLSHPNVVPVYEVGALDDQLFVAMEFVEGENLRAWRERTGPDWRRQLEVFVQAGRGLEAAHDAGLVHRDFKPENVLLGVDGRVRVLDFGLARAREDHPAEPPSDRPPLPTTANGRATSNPLATPLTVDGAMVGTPAYMAPEQIEGGTVDARTDQFSFALTLWWSLFGQHPFGEGTLVETLLATSRAELRSPPPGSPVPTHVRRALTRALSRDPEQRFPSTGELLAELGRDPGARSRRRLATAAVAIAVTVAAVAGWRALSTRQQLCRGAATRLAGVWDDGRRAEVAGAFLGSGARNAEAALDAVERSLDGYAADWMAMHEEACAATRLRGEQSTEVMDLRMACLDRSRAQLGAFVGLLAQADADLVAESAEAAARLEPVAGCGDVRALTAPVRPPSDPATRLEVARLGEELGRAVALRAAGRDEAALDASSRLVEEARRVGYPPLLAEALLEEARNLDELGLTDTSEDSAFAALVAARAGGHQIVEIEALAELVWIAGYQRNDDRDTLRWAELARAALERLGGSPRLEALLEQRLGTIAREQDRFDEATERLTRAIALRRAAGDVDDLDMATLLNNLGNTHKDAGRYDEALALHREALEIRRRRLGGEHPEVAMSLSNLGNVLRRLERAEEAVEVQQQALDIRERALGPKHPAVAASLINTANALLELDRRREAEGLYRRALGIVERTRGPEHDLTANACVNLGRTLYELGELAEARELVERGRSIYERNHSAVDSRVALCRFYLGQIARARGDLETAARELESAAELERRALGDDHPDRIETLIEAAAVRASQGDRPRRRELLEEAARIGALDGTPFGVATTARLALADALWEDGLRERAAAVVTAGLDRLSEAGQAGDELRRRLDGWLAGHRP